MKHFFIVYGKEIAGDFSNVKSIATKVIPNIGERIAFKEATYTVLDKVIDYRQVQGHDLDSSERGGELIYIFV